MAALIVFFFCSATTDHWLYNGQLNVSIVGELTRMGFNSNVSPAPPWVNYCGNVSYIPLQQSQRYVAAGPPEVKWAQQGTWYDQGVTEAASPPLRVSQLSSRGAGFSVSGPSSGTAPPQSVHYGLRASAYGSPSHFPQHNDRATYEA